MEEKYLYGATIHGIQSFIFDSNTLKTIIGGSEIIEKISTTFFIEHITDYNDKFLLQAAAGSIKYVFQNKSDCEKFFKDFPYEVNKIAPGIVFTQAVVKINGTLTQEHMQDLSKKLNAQRNIPPVLPDIGIMGRGKARLSGKALHQKNNELNDYVDLLTHNKIEYSKDSELLSKKSELNGKQFPKQFSEITKGSEKHWMAVIHADGNGIGNTILNIINNNNNSTEILKKFSKLLNDATIEAFKEASETVFYNFSGGVVPIRPVILGGDDMTVIIRADFALKFTKEYLIAFENKTCEKFKKLNIKFLNNRLQASAGIAFVKEKFPFHYAVHLAESLCSYAKNKSERKYSAIMFHKVQDSFFTSFDEIIKKELSIGNTLLVNGPYSVVKTKLKPIQTIIEQANTIQNKDFPKGALRKWSGLVRKNESAAKQLMNRMFENHEALMNVAGITKNGIDSNLHIFDLLVINSFMK